MFISDFLFVLILSLLLTGLFAFGLRRQRAREILLGFFIFLFFLTWAVGVWVTPIWGVPWMSFIVVGLFFALLLTALTPPTRPPRSREELHEFEKSERRARQVFDVYTVILILGLTVAIIAFYI